MLKNTKSTNFYFKVIRSSAPLDGFSPEDWESVPSVRTRAEESAPTGPWCWSGLRGSGGLAGSSGGCWQLLFGEPSRQKRHTHHTTYGAKCTQRRRERNFSYLAIVFFNVQRAKAGHFCREHICESPSALCHGDMKKSTAREHTSKIVVFKGNLDSE